MNPSSTEMAPTIVPQPWLQQAGQAAAMIVCGGGFLAAAWLADRYPYLPMVALALLGLAVARWWYGAPAAEAAPEEAVGPDVSALPIEQAIFDAGMLMGAQSHMPDPERKLMMIQVAGRLLAYARHAQAEA